MARGDVVFSFNPSDYTNVTRDDTGEWLDIRGLPIDDVCVAGEFNDWSKDAWQMTKGRSGVYELSKSWAAFRERQEWQFKFVINGFYWVEPPAEAPNRVPSGAWRENRSYNLVVRIP
jgi:hypothetical protein